MYISTDGSNSKLIPQISSTTAPSSSTNLMLCYDGTKYYYNPLITADTQTREFNGTTYYLNTNLPTIKLNNGSTTYTVCNNSQYTRRTYTRTYNQNGNTSLTQTVYYEPNNSEQGASYNKWDIITSANLLSPTVTKTGYTFENWDYNGTNYSQNASLSTSYGNITINAEYTPNTYYIHYYGNGNTGGSTATMTCKYDTSYNLTSNGFTKTGHSFKEWNLNSSGTSTSYSNGASVKNLNAKNGAYVYLYAIWSVNKYITYFKYIPTTSANISTYNGYYYRSYNTENSSFNYGASVSCKNETVYNDAYYYIYTPAAYYYGSSSTPTSASSTRTYTQQDGTRYAITLYTRSDDYYTMSSGSESYGSSTKVSTRSDDNYNYYYYMYPVTKTFTASSNVSTFTAPSYSAYSISSSYGSFSVSSSGTGTVTLKFTPSSYVSEQIVSGTITWKDPKGKTKTQNISMKIKGYSEQESKPSTEDDLD